MAAQEGRIVAIWRDGGQPHTTPDIEPDLDSRPVTQCGCGFELVWIDGHWEHDAAPSMWGDDHDAHPDSQPDPEARAYWDEIDGA